jgi:peptidoglycan/LPS O-acetylase OafA/YrhL
MSVFQTYCRLTPVATLSTLLFYGAVLVALFSRRYRAWMTARLAPALPSNHAYSGALDSYRGIAAAVVAFAHMGYFCYPLFWASVLRFPYLIAKGGNKAVPVFVMLSGFLIYRSVRKVASLQDLQDYARRRFLRIFPLYVVTALAALAVGQVALTVPTVLAELLMLRSLSFPTFINPVTWSLYVEVCFYVALPVFVVATGRWVLWASVGAFFALLFADPAGPREMDLWKYFFVGIVVSHLTDWLAARPRPRLLREALGVALFAAGAVLLYYDFHEHDWFGNLGLLTENPSGYGEVGTVGLACGFGLVMVGTLTSQAVSRIAGVWPLRVVGTISYSLFLIHPFYLLVNFPQLMLVGGVHPQPSFAPLGVAPWWYGFFLFFPGMLLWAAASYIAIERPFQMMRPQRAKPRQEGAAQEVFTVARRAA